MALQGAPVNPLRKGLAYLTSDDCRAVVDINGVIRSVEQAFRWQAEGSVIVPEGSSLQMKTPPPGYTSHVKAAILLEPGVAGVRTVGYRVNPEGSRPDAEHSTRFVLLSDLATALPFALIDEHYNYNLRTAASVAAAARKLAPKRPVLGIVGVGHVGEAVARIFDALLPLECIMVTSRRPESRRKFVNEHRERLSTPIEAVDDVGTIVAETNVIVTATTASEPLIFKNQIRPGTLICALGSFELEPEVYGVVDKVCVDDWTQTCAKKDMQPVLKRGLLSQEILYAEIGQIVIGKRKGRISDDEVWLIRTEGLVSQDIALALWSYEKALAKGMFRWIVPPQ